MHAVRERAPFHRLGLQSLCAAGIPNRDSPCRASEAGHNACYSQKLAFRSCVRVHKVGWIIWTEHLTAMCNALIVERQRAFSLKCDSGMCHRSGLSIGTLDGFATGGVEAENPSRIGRSLPYQRPSGNARDLIRDSNPRHCRGYTVGHHRLRETTGEPLLAPPGISWRTGRRPIRICVRRLALW